MLPAAFNSPPEPISLISAHRLRAAVAPLQRHYFLSLPVVREWGSRLGSAHFDSLKLKPTLKGSTVQVMASAKPLQECGREGQGDVLLHWHSRGKTWNSCNWLAAALKLLSSWNPQDVCSSSVGTQVPRVATVPAQTKNSCPWRPCSHRACADGVPV